MFAYLVSEIFNDGDVNGNNVSVKEDNDYLIDNIYLTIVIGIVLPLVLYYIK